MIKLLPVIDSDQIAETRKAELAVSRQYATELGRTAIKAIEEGYYRKDGKDIHWKKEVDHAVQLKRSIPPGENIPLLSGKLFQETRLQISNETTLGASHRLTEMGLKPLALNFANGVSAGGGFYNGARAQEEVLCRSSALYATLRGDPMYAFHKKRPEPDSSDWVIYSPNVPVFRNDDGSNLDKPWLLSFITCAAPYAARVGQPKSADLLKKRIHRVLKIAKFLGYSTLVLGAWGCGAFKNDVQQTASDFRTALETEFSGSFSEIVFAITDWSEERRILGPFCETFNS